MEYFAPGPFYSSLEIQIVHELNQSNYNKRVVIRTKILRSKNRLPNCSDLLIMSGAAQFNLSDYDINKHKMRYRRTENPKKLHPEHLLNVTP